MVGEYHQGHHRQYHEQVGAEDAVGTIEPDGQVSRRIESAEKKKDREQAEYHFAQRVESQPALHPPEGFLLSRREDRHRGQPQVHQRPHRQQPRPPTVRRQGKRRGCHRQGEQDQNVKHWFFLGLRLSLLFQLSQVLGADRRDLAANVMDDDAHHEHAGEQIEQYANLDEKRHRFQKQHSKQEDAVLQQQIAEDLADGFASARQQ